MPQLTEFNVPDYSNTIFKILQDDRLRRAEEREATKFIKEQDPNSTENQFKRLQIQKATQDIAQGQEEAKNAVIGSYFQGLAYVEPNEEDYNKFYKYYTDAGIPSYMIRKPSSFLKDPDINGNRVFDSDAFDKYKKYVFDVRDMTNGKLSYDTVDVDIPTGEEGKFRTIKYPAVKGKVFDPTVIDPKARIHEKEATKRLYPITKDGKVIYSADAEGAEVGTKESPTAKENLEIRRREFKLKEEEQQAKKEKGNLGGGGKFKWTGQLTADGKNMIVYNEETQETRNVPVPKGMKAKPASEKPLTPIQKKLAEGLNKKKAQELANSNKYEDVRITRDGKIAVKKDGKYFYYETNEEIQ